MRRAALCLVLLGCGRAPEGDGIRIIGGPGAIPGRFATPRAAARDAQGRLFTVDKSGRVQRFSADGAFEAGWSTPEIAKGRPTGIACGPGGTVLVADTHYHRILRYSADGALLSSFGGEGLEPGKFCYPTGVAVAADGTVFVSEFGGNETNGNDRIQVFTPEGKPLRQWGRYGDGPGEFKRPQGIALAGDLLVVADAANHRVQVFRTDGTFVRQWGDVKYPYGVSVDGDGNVLVAEYGRHRISKFSPEGRLLAAAGGPGVGPGELNTPWGVLAAGPIVYVVDTLNHRLQVWPAARLGGAP